MEYQINLLRPQKKSKFRVNCGIILLAIGLIYGAVSFRHMEYYHWILFGLYIFAGLAYLLNGLGYFTKLFSTKAYVKVTDNGIYSKLGRKGLIEKANWDEIESIEYKSNRFTIKRKDNTSFDIFSPLLSFENIQELKNIIQEKANNNYISFVIG